MQDTIHTMFVNEKIIRIYIYFVHSHHETQKRWDLTCNWQEKTYNKKIFLKNTRKITKVYLNAYNNKRHL